MRSIWFPSMRELRAWKASRSALYLRWLSPTTFEVGPRTENMWAACFSPVLRASLEVGEAKPGLVVLGLRRGYPRLTTAILSLWVLIDAAWLRARLSLTRYEDGDPTWLIWWGVLFFATVAAPLVGRVMGGRALDLAEPDLYRAAVEPIVEGEDW